MRPGERLRLWIVLNKAPLALVLILLSVAIAASLLTGGWLWAVQGQGSSRPVEGVIESFGMQERDQGSYRVAVVRTPDSRITVRAPVRRACRVGDHVVLIRKPIRVGSLYTLRSCRAG